MSFIKSVYLSQLVQGYTHVCSLGQTVIDLVFSDDDSTCRCEVLIKPNITDHHLVQITLNCNNKRNIKKCIVRKPLADPLDLRNRLININFDYSNEDLNYKREFFVNSVRKIINKIMPTKEIICNENKKWFNKTVLEATKLRDDKFKKYKTTMQQKDWVEYKDSRNAVVNVVRKEKREFLKASLDECRGNPRLLWKTLKTLILKPKSEVYTNIVFDNNLVVRNKKELVHSFNIIHILLKV